MYYLLKTKIKYKGDSDEFMEMCLEVAEAQADNDNWIWKIWGHNPEEKIVEITYLIDNEEDMQKGIDFIESFGALYKFLVDYCRYEQFEVMEEHSRLTNAPFKRDKP